MKVNQEPEPIPAEDLRGLFAHRRPDPDAFRAGVEKRIAKRRAAKDGGAGSEARERGMTFLRRVATVLPIDPVTGGKAGSATIKFLYATLALPALVLASTIGGFVASARALRRETKYAIPAQTEPLRWRWRRIHSQNDDLVRGGQLMVVANSGILITLVLSFLDGGRVAIDVLTGVLMVAMGVVVLIIRGLAQEGLLSRRKAARFAVSFLVTVFSGCFLWMSTVLAVPDGHARLGLGWASCIVLVGIVACVTYAWDVRRGALALFLALLVFFGYNPLAITKSTPGSLAEQLVSIDLDPESLQGWEEAEAIFMALQALDERTPDLHITRDRLARAIEKGTDVHPVVWTAAAHMGLIRDAQWSRIAEGSHAGRALDALLQEGRPMGGSDYDEYRVPMLLATRDLSPEERKRLADNAVAAWPVSGQHGALLDAAMLVRVFEWMDRQDLVQGHASAIRDLLVDYWIAPGTTSLFGNAGGFTSNPEKFRTSFPDDTWAAIELMARVGVPDAVDRYWLRGYLRNESRATPLLFEMLPTHRAMPRAALLRLERELGMPQRSWFKALLAERLLIAAVLLVTLCLLAIRLSPERAEQGGEGAQP